MSGAGGSGGAGGMSGAGGSGGAGGMSGAGGSGGAGGMSGAGGSGGAGGMSGAGGSSGAGGGAAGGNVDGGTDVAPDSGSDAPSGDGPSEAGPPVDVGSGAPDPVTNLAAAVLDRRETSIRLTWTAPASSTGTRVAGYQVRSAKVPITSANFGDSTVTSVVPYTTTPATPGTPDGVTAAGLYIETNYYFAVEALGGDGTPSTLVPTTVPVAAHFNVTLLNGQNSTDNMGYFVDGTGDFGSSSGNSFTGDGLSDLLVGNILAKNCYLYFGTPAGYAATPSITFTSNAGWYGASVANVGDIDGDGLADIAISSPQDGNGKVFIFSRKNPPASWGTTTSWPATLADTQANYVITADAAAAGKNFGRPIAPVGDYDGDGLADFAISSLPYGGVGRVVIVKGSNSFGSVTLPDTTNTITFDGTAASGQFGSALLGVGPIFGPQATLLTSARPASALYAFGGTSGPGPIPATSAGDSVVYSPTTGGYGYSFGFLGALGSSPYAVAVTANVDQLVDIHLGTAATGPFTGPAGGAPAPSLRIKGPTANSWGAVNIGGGVPTTTRQVSFVGGDTVPDLVLSGQADPNGPTVYLIDGNVLASTTGTITISAAAPPTGVIVVPGLPADWNGHAFKSSVVPDVNGDGYGDFAIGELVTTRAGRVAVFY
jgi:hypothetical protein